MSDSIPELQFPSVAGKPVRCRFDGGDVTSDAGLLFLSQVDRRLHLSERMAAQILDCREFGKVEHSVEEQLRARIFAIAAGYEDANDLDTLCSDPALLLSCGKRLDGRLASQPTISRWENRVSRKDVLLVGWELAQVVAEQLPSGTQHVVLDVDATEDECHGQQEFEFFNGFYDSHCYLPLYLYVTGEDGRQRLMASMLRHGKAGWKAGLFGLLGRAVALLRERFASLRITLRADGGFGNGEVLAFCREVGLSYVLGVPTNSRLREQTAQLEARVLQKTERTGADGREHTAFFYQAGPWAQPERVVAKVETVKGQLNVRYVVTSRRGARPEAVYRFYCGRGDAENRIKEMKGDLASGRTSCHRFVANQLRLLLHQAACILFSVVQEALAGTAWANAQIGTLRLRLLKVGARVVRSSRWVWLHLPTSCPAQSWWRYLHQRLVQTPT
jgi:hypothetical protein